MEYKTILTEEEIQIERENLLRETQPYYDMLVKIQAIKMPIAILNIGTKEVRIDYGEDLPIEKQIKGYIDSINEKYLSKVLIKP